MKKFKSLKSILVLALAVILALSVFTGCGKKNTEESAGGINAADSKYGTEYPLDAEGITLTYWMPITANISESAQNFGELPIAKELEKLTGVKIEYVHPSLTNSAEKFNLMIASGEFTDMIRYSWNSYPGGAQAAIDEEIIVPLNEEGNNMIDAWAPDFKAVLESSEDALREAKTDKGYIFSVGCIAPARELNTTAGPIVRQDWLDELGIESPKTIDDWYVMLKAFKEKKGATAPLTMSGQGFFCGFVSGAYGQNLDFYHDNGVVKFGPAEQGWKETVTTLNKWYKEGLFDKNFATTDATTITANLLNGKSGATWNALGGGIGVLTNAIKEKDPKAVFAGAVYPTLDGSKSQFGQASARFQPYAAITTQCKDPELAMKWLNFGYTDEGHMLYNFGIEGQSYEWVDKEHRKLDDEYKYVRNADGEIEIETSKYPQYTEEITANPKGLSMQQAFTVYSEAGQGGNYRQDLRYLEQYAALPQQQEAWIKWCDTDAFEHYVPNTGVAEADAKRYSQLYTDICKERDENWIKFISGERPLDEFDDFVKDLEKIGLKEMLEIKQAAFDAYLAR